MDKIICIGKNYIKHALELGDAVPEEPVYFIKPPSTLVSVTQGAHVPIHWPRRNELHHELELVFRVGKTPNGFELTHYTVGLDMTLRDLQSRLKKASQPWEKAKTFLNSAIIGPWLPITSFESVLDIEFSLKVNGQIKQSSRGRDQRWLPTVTLKDLQNWFPIRDGDLLFTGTPEGVGPVEDGDLLEIMAGDLNYKLTAKREG